MSACPSAFEYFLSIFLNHCPTRPLMLCFQSSEHIGGTSGGEELREGTVVENPGPVNDSDTGVTEAEVKDGRGKKKTERKRKRTHLGPRIKVYSTFIFCHQIFYSKVLRIVTEEENTEPGQEEDRDQGDAKTGVKVECQMETSKQKTVTFEFHTTDIGPEEMANTFIMEDLLAEQHRRILVEQLIDIANQLADDPETVPQARIILNSCDHMPSGFSCHSSS